MAQAKGKIAKEFLVMMDAWHSIREPRDQELDALIHRMYADKLEELSSNFKPDFSIPYFSPSSANACPRELYHKAKGERADNEGNQPHQGRWTRIGTAWGDVVQRDLLFIEKHFEKLMGQKPRFVPAKTIEGYPKWEEFVLKQTPVTHNGEAFSILGTSDGILEYDDGTGKYDIGLEVKSKQTTNAQTSLYSMREPYPNHIKQVVAYSIMYELDRFLIVYGNLSKKRWHMTEEDYKKTPDFRVFEVAITDADKRELLDFFADIVRRVRENDPPRLQLDKWTFNGHKNACARSLTDDEIAELKDEVRAIRRSNAPEWKKQSHYDALQDIIERRKAQESDGK